MTTHSPQPEGPQRFVRNWLAFNESRLAHAHLLRNLAGLVAALLIASAVLATISH